MENGAIMKYINRNQALKIIKIVEVNFPAPLRNHSCVKAYWVPIELLEYTQLAYKCAGIQTHCRFRGPRNNPADRRSLVARNQDCLKKFATHFTVYPRG